MAVAATLSRRSRCDGRQVGAVIVSADNAYSVVGYNGPPGRMELPAGSSCRDWCPRMLSGERSTSYGNCMTAHAEANALTRADHSRIQGGTLYVTSACCWDCGKLIANSGITTVYMHLSADDWHRDPLRTIEMLRSCGIEVFSEGVQA